MVYAMSMIRRWLRALIGWEEMVKSVADNDERLDAETRRVLGLFDRIESHETRLCKLQRRADTAPAKMVDLDWEAQQQAFLSNPENFKEQN